MQAKIGGVLVKGHQVASGRSPTSPYPKGTIELQKPFFKRLGLDLADCFNGTLNLSLEAKSYDITQADFSFKQVIWLEGYHPETFSFVRCHLKYKEHGYDGWIYHPHPETKSQHFQEDSILEVLAPPIANIQYAEKLTLYYDPQKIEFELKGSKPK